MSILNYTIPVANEGVTFTEVPDRISVFFNIANCNAHCKDCHSPYLWKNTRRKTVTDILNYAQTQTDKGATAIVLMGGTTNGIDEDVLVKLINLLDEIAPVCLYSGSDDMTLNFRIAINSHLTWIKTGSYQPKFGGLDKLTTNQRFYHKDGIAVTMNNWAIENVSPTFTDETYKFRETRRGE